MELTDTYQLHSYFITFVGSFHSGLFKLNRFENFKFVNKKMIKNKFNLN